MQTLIDEDGNAWNVSLEISNGNLIAICQDMDEPYYIDLKHDRIDIFLK